MERETTGYEPMDIHAPKQWAILEGTPGRERGRDGRRVLETAGPEGVPRDQKERGKERGRKRGSEEERGRGLAAWLAVDRASVGSG